MELRWCSSRTAAPGGAVAIRTAAERKNFLPLPLFFVFGLFLLSHSLLLVLSLLPLSSGLSLFLSGLLLFLFFDFFCIYRGRKDAGTIVSAGANHATAGRPVSKGGGDEEREAGRFEKKTKWFSSSAALLRGEGGDE